MKMQNVCKEWAGRMKGNEGGKEKEEEREEN